jgi:hypothetical protein
MDRYEGRPWRRIFAIRLQAYDRPRAHRRPDGQYRRVRSQKPADEEADGRSDQVSAGSEPGADHASADIAVQRMKQRNAIIHCCVLSS